LGKPPRRYAGYLPQGAGEVRLGNSIQCPGPCGGSMGIELPHGRGARLLVKPRCFDLPVSACPSPSLCKGLVWLSYSGTGFILLSDYPVVKAAGSDRTIIHYIKQRLASLLFHPMPGRGYLARRRHAAPRGAAPLRPLASPCTPGFRYTGVVLMAQIWGMGKRSYARGKTSFLEIWVLYSRGHVRVAETNPSGASRHLPFAGKELAPRLANTREWTRACAWGTHHEQLVMSKTVEPKPLPCSTTETC